LAVRDGVVVGVALGVVDIVGVTEGAAMHTPSTGDAHTSVHTHAPALAFQDAPTRAPVVKLEHGVQDCTVVLVPLMYPNTGAQPHVQVPFTPGVVEQACEGEGEILLEGVAELVKDLVGERLGVMDLVAVGDGVEEGGK